MKNKLIIVAGCSGSGKTRVANKIKDSFKDKAQILCLDRFYNENKKDIVKVKESGN
ncbi:MAG: zeta toxin family protein [Mycoplasmoidaceae bacterium]|nr:zeta toxin family protein [Mycoplasmoidaceae bacterium]